MLRHLHIQNYALISHLDIDFKKGFSVMTGETGAGKSIILGALNLVMGGRADTKTITEGEDKCIIEAEFGEEQNTQETILIRRELNSNGRSRSFVNDELITQSELKLLANRLIDIHSQHENLLLSDSDFQLNIVDLLAQNDSERTAYSTQYEAYLSAKEVLQKTIELARKTKADADYIQFQYHQLEEANLQSGEQEELEEEHYRLANAEDIRLALQDATQNLNADDRGALSLIHAIHLEDADKELSDRLRSVEIELRDIAHEAERKAESTEVNPQRLQEVEDRIALITSLLKKHNLQNEDELIALREQLAEQCTKIDSFDDEIAKLTKQLDEQTLLLKKAADALTKSRKAVVPSISAHLVEDLTKLGIAHAQIDVWITPTEDYTATGCDDIQFMFAANLNQTVRRVSEVASGGELSRLMLCIKSLVATTNGLPTIIFDEIDTGVSGDIATQMGRIMHQMSTSRQIIAITHNPQIAVQADQQFLVYKQDENEHTETHIRVLSTDERQQYIDQYYATISRAIASKDAE